MCIIYRAIKVPPTWNIGLLFTAESAYLDYRLQNMNSLRQKQSGYKKQ